MEDYRSSSSTNNSPMSWYSMDNNVLQHGHAQHVLSVPFKCALRFVLSALSSLLNTLSPLFHATDLDCTHLDAVLDGEDSVCLTCAHQKIAS